MTNLDAFILIGGRSSRMGRDKATLEIGGKTFVERARDTISNAFPASAITLVAARLDQVSNDLPVIVDIHKDRGPLGGLDAALKHSTEDCAFILACDMPLVTETSLQFLASFIDGDHDAVVPIQPDGRLQPLCAFYRVAACQSVVNEMLSSTDTLATAAIFDRVRTCTVQVSGDVFTNVNTPEEFNELIARGLK